ncbi:unnamed protein product [Didymodactylos carnosus]|uniref:Uncharacterized protein n=1 Tax=Didymodactylos carnosus TaxID=1234261 RepID=A0A8S2QJC8_9BILA|nr:unnamed protein product [Didymodactylos carnosus]CAF4109047.1 unnamed protein product [Didymodactylos carnosus]
MDSFPVSACYQQLCQLALNYTANSNHRQNTTYFSSIQDYCNIYIASADNDKEIYKILIEILLKYSQDYYEIINEYKQIAVLYENKSCLEESILMYDRILEFIIKYHTPSEAYHFENDLVTGIIYVYKNRFLVHSSCNIQLKIVIYRKILHLLHEYHLHMNPDHIKPNESIQCYFELAKYDLQMYSELIEFILKEKSELYNETMENIIKTWPKNEQLKLIDFIQKYRVNYKSLISEIITHPLSIPTTITKSAHVNRNVSNCYRNLNQKTVELLLKYLLKHHFKDDERIASCYQTLSNYQAAIDMFLNQQQENSVYTDEMLNLNSNVCRRFLKSLCISYQQMRTNEKIKILQQKYRQHFDSNNQIYPINDDDE